MGLLYLYIKWEYLITPLVVTALDCSNFETAVSNFFGMFMDIWDFCNLPSSGNTGFDIN
jgi:hypothetical protein